MLNSLFDNAGSLLLALLLALMVWMVAVTQGQGPPIRESYPEDGLKIEAINVPEGLVIFDEFNRRATMDVLAPQPNIDRLSPADFRVYVDLSELTPGLHELPVQWQCAECGQKHVDVLGVEPEAVSIRLEQSAERSVPVRLSLQGSTAVGFRAQPPSVDPEEVTVSGARSLVEQVTSARLDLYLFNEDSTVQRTVNLTAVDGDGNLVGGVKLSPERAEVIVAIVPEGQRKEVAVTPNISGTVAPGYYATSISVEPQTVILTGPASRVREAAGFVETEPVSISGATSSVEVRVPIRIPEGLELLDSAQQTVTVKVAVSPFTGGRSFEVKPVIEGRGQGLEVQVSPPQIQVFLAGPLPDVELLTEDDIRVILDLSELGPGRHRIEPIVEVGKESLEKRTLPEVVEINITPEATPTPTITPTPEATPTPSEDAR